MSHFDAIMLSSFGGPEGQNDVIPFLRNVTVGRGVPDSRLEEVAKHYRYYNGISPINEQNRQLRAAIETELFARGIRLPVLWANRNWAPYFADIIHEAQRNGQRKLLAIVTSAYTSYSGVGQYREDFEKATAGTQVSVDRVREFFDHPGFLVPFIEQLESVVTELQCEGISPEETQILFVTHSIPTAAADASGVGFGPGGAYVAQHLAVAEYLHAQSAPKSTYRLVYQSRSGDPNIPWLEPDINDAINEIAVQTNPPRVLIIAPIGFVSDHIEILWDLDNEAYETATNHGFIMRRLSTPGTHPVFVAGLVDLIEERLTDTPVKQRPHLTSLGPWPDHEPVNPPEGENSSFHHETSYTSV